MSSGRRLFAVRGGRVALHRPLMLRLRGRSQPGPARVTLVDAPASVYGVAHVDTGALQSGVAGMRFIAGSLGHRGYAGPRPIPGHGPHRARFQVFALDEPIPNVVTTAKALLKQMAGHALAQGVLTGTYERA